MEKGKLYLKTDSGLEFVKECEQREYIELAIETPGQYAFVPYSKPNHTIQDLNDFATRAMQKSKTDIKAKNKQAFFKIKSISHWAALSGILATIIAIWVYIIKPLIDKIK